jgi:hypothetical protein
MVRSQLSNHQIIKSPNYHIALANIAVGFNRRIGMAAQHTGL